MLGDDGLTDIDETHSEIEEDADISTSFFADNEQPETSTDYSEFLYEGAPAGLTKYIGHLLVFQYSVKHSLTSKALEELLNLLSVFLPSGAQLAKSVYHLKNFFVEIYKEQQPVFHPYCTDCHKQLDESESCDCGGSKSKFISVPIGPQLKSRLEGK